VHDWDRAVEIVGLDPDALLVETIDAGSSNCVMALNEGGQTWAGAIRSPASADLAEEFVAEKIASLSTVDMLADRLRDGVVVSAGCVLKFGGLSCLVDADSALAFVRGQAGKSFEVSASFEERVKKIVGMDLAVAAENARHEARLVLEALATYTGPMFLSRGAPASETTEDFPQRAPLVARSLGVLHSQFPQSPQTETDVQRLLERASASLRQAALAWSPAVDSNGVSPVDKLQKKWAKRLGAAAAAAAIDPETVRLEAFLRSRLGRSVVREAVPQLEVGSGFVHGDAHVGNFILVDFRFEPSKAQKSTPIDRTFVNETFDRHPDLELLHYSLTSDGARVTDLAVSDALPLRRRDWMEVHPIDLDDAQFGSRLPQAVDAITYAISAENACSALGEPHVTADVVLAGYLEGLG
jgi:hypothetical protein